MKKSIKILSATMAVVMLFSLAGCGKDNNGGDNGSNEATNTSSNPDSVNKGTASEDYFEWNGNLISALTDSGAQQTSIVIPERCEGFDALIFADRENSVTSVSFESDKDIDLNNVFNLSKNLTSITLPAGLTKVSDFEFWQCESLKEINIPANVTSIGEYAFQDSTALETITFEGNLTTIGMYAFDGCSALKNIVFPDSVTSIGESAFLDCTALESVTLPTSLIEVQKLAFADSGLQTINVPESVALSKYDPTCFVQRGRSVTVNVVEGSWMDQNFDSVFEGAFTKNYSK